jgi:Potato inhibitor I family
MADHPTVSTEGGYPHGDHDGFEVNHDKSTTTKAGQPPASPRRRRTYLAAAIVGLVLIVGIIVVLSLSLTGAFDKSGGSTPSSATSSSSSLPESESAGGGTNPNSSSGGNDPNRPVPNTTSSTPVSNGTQTGGDGSSSSSNSTSGNSGGSTTAGAPSLTVAGGAQYPTDSHEFLDIWSGDAANATAMTFDNGETVSIRWPECLAMVPDECETLVRSTNPYVNDVYVLGPFDYTTDEFRNDRVNLYTDENYAAVTQVPTIG